MGFDWKRVGKVSVDKLIEKDIIQEKNREIAEKLISERALVEFQWHIKRVNHNG